MDILPSLLPYLTNLSQINIAEVDIPLLDVLNSHPLTVILLKLRYPWRPLPIPSHRGPSDLAKVALESYMMDCTKLCDLNPYLARGMEVRQMSLYQLDALDKSFGVRNYNGLCELELLELNKQLLSSSWLSEFAQHNPQLKKIIFLDNTKEYFSPKTKCPLISSFLAEVHSEGLNDTMTIISYAITRSGPSAASTTEPFSQWHVSGMLLEISQWNSGRVLHLVHSWFPRISALSIQCKRAYGIVCIPSVIR